MMLREKIDRLMKNAKIATYKELLRRIYKQFGEDSAYEKAERDKGNFTKMLNGERELNSKYYVPIERIFDIRIHIGVAEKATITKMTNIRYYNDLRLACLFIVKSLHR